jgi:hypothetical protein
MLWFYFDEIFILLPLLSVFLCFYWHVFNKVSIILFDFVLESYLGDMSNMCSVYHMSNMCLVCHICQICVQCIICRIYVQCIICRICVQCSYVEYV